MEPVIPAQAGIQEPYLPFYTSGLGFRPEDSVVNINKPSMLSSVEACGKHLYKPPI